MSDVKIGQGLKNAKVINIGTVRIEVSGEDYQAMLAEIDADLARRNEEANRKHANGQKRLNDSWQAISDLREILYEREGEYFLMREKPDQQRIDAFVDKYAKLMGFER